MTIDLSTVPLIAISAASKQAIAIMLNPMKVLSSDNGLPRDWRGLAHLLEFNAEIMSLLVSHSDPTMHMLTMLEKNQKNITIKNFQTMMEQIDRWDIIDDTEGIFQSDAVRYLEFQRRAQTSADPIDEHIDREVLTLGDVHRLKQGLETQNYDAFLLYAEEDINFVNEMIEKLETEYKLKLCLKDRDLIGGTFEHETVMKLISKRCNRLLIIVSPSFLESPANKFFLNYAQALSIEKRQRKIIPCIYKTCELPVQLKYIFNLDYNRKGLYDFWGKLHDSIQASNSLIASNTTQLEHNNVSQEIIKLKNISPDNFDTSQTNQKVKSEETSKYSQNNGRTAVAKANDIKVVNASSIKNKTLLQWEKITGSWKTRQSKRTSQLITETTIQNLPSVDNLDSLDLSSTNIYENKKKKLFSKFTKKSIAFKT